MGAIRAVMAHEYRRCHQSLEAFHVRAREGMRRRPSKERRIELFELYSSFLHHLYEFMLAAIELRHGPKKARDHKKVDGFLADEAEKVRKNRLDRIARGDAPRWMKASAHQQPIPASFAEALREVRNCVAHARVDRAGTGKAPSLAEF